MKEARKLDDLRRISIPQEMLVKLGWTARTVIDIEIMPNQTLRLRPSTPQ